MEGRRTEIPCYDCGEFFPARVLNGHELDRCCGKCEEARESEQQAARTRHEDVNISLTQQRWIADPKGGIPAIYRGFTWDDFLFDKGGGSNRKRVGDLRRYAEEFPVVAKPEGVPSLVLASETNGVGKTMLATLLLRDIIRRCGNWKVGRCPFQFWTGSAIEDRLRKAEDFKTGETVADVYDDLGSLSLLVIDDFAKEFLDGDQDRAARKRYRKIIDRRYEAGLPVVLTSNLEFVPWQQGGMDLGRALGRPTVSRLVGMTRAQFFIIEGEDRR